MKGVWASERASAAARAVIGAVALAAAVGLATPAAAQQSGISRDLQDLMDRRQDVDNQLRQLEQDLNQFKRELQQGQQIVSSFNAIVQNYKRYQDSLVQRYDSCIKLELQADSLREEANPLAPRFEARARECAAEVKSDELLADVYRRVFENIRTKVEQIKRGLDAIEAGIESTAARQAVRQNERDLIEYLIDGAEETDTFIEPFRGF